jgi:hypothetical protein
LELRKQLTPPEIPETRRETVRKRIREIEAVLAQGQDADDLIQKFNDFTGHQYDEYTFRNYWRSIDLDDFVQQASRLPPRRVENITREELIEIVRWAMSDDPDNEFYRELFDANVIMPAASSLIYYPVDYEPTTLTWSGGSINDYDPTPEEIVEIALSYRPIVTPPPDA